MTDSVQTTSGTTTTTNPVEMDLRTLIPESPLPLNLDAFIVNLKSLIQHKPKELTKLTTRYVIPASEIQSLLISLKKALALQPMLIDISSPIKIVGDLHGQYSDLLRIFNHCGWPPSTRYLFLGDYVDRGQLGVETFALVGALKLKHPKAVFMLRGNHECRDVNVVYGFYDEVLKKYGEKSKLWELFSEIFDNLPIAALVDGKFFCVHGGLSPEMESLDQVRLLPKPRAVAAYGIMTDLMWSDPERTIDGWAENTRGISYTFGADVVRSFCRQHNIAMIVRGHQVPEAQRCKGYKFFAGMRMLTLFSAPNYCRTTLNDCAVLNVMPGLVCKFEILSPDENLRLTYAEKLKQTFMWKYNL